jgi:hypothetical protein
MLRANDFAFSFAISYAAILVGMKVTSLPLSKASQAIFRLSHRVDPFNINVPARPSTVCLRVLSFGTCSEP